LKHILTAGAVALCLSGCGGGASAGPGSSGPALVMARVKDAVVLDPSHATDGLSLNVTNEVMQNLVAFKPGSFELTGDVAKSWKSSAGGKTWTFELNPNLIFADGTPLDAKAVETAIAFGDRIVELGVAIKDIDERQAVAPTDLEIVEVVCRRDLDRAAPCLGIGMFVGDNGNAPPHQGQDHMLADEIAVTLAVGRNVRVACGETTVAAVWRRGRHCGLSRARIITPPWIPNGRRRLHPARPA